MLLRRIAVIQQSVYPSRPYKPYSEPSQTALAYLETLQALKDTPS